MYPDSLGSPDSRDCRRLLQGTTADDPFLTFPPFEEDEDVYEQRRKNPQWEPLYTAGVYGTFTR